MLKLPSFKHIKIMGADSKFAAYLLENGFVKRDPNPEFKHRSEHLSTMGTLAFLYEKDTEHGHIGFLIGLGDTSCGIYTLSMYKDREYIKRHWTIQIGDQRFFISSGSKFMSWMESKFEPGFLYGLLVKNDPLVFTCDLAYSDSGAHIEQMHKIESMDPDRNLTEIYTFPK